MRLPNRNIGGFAKEIIDECSASRTERIQRGAMYRNMYLTADENANTQIYNATYEYMDALSSYLFSPVELRFGVEFYGSSSPLDRAMGYAASSELHKQIRPSNLDIMIGEAVDWSLVKGKSFIKLLWSSNGFEPYLVQPEMMGVLREDITSLDEQEAFFHTTYYTPQRFQQLIENNPDKDDILKKVKKYLEPGKGTDQPDRANSLKQIVLGGLYPYVAAGSNSSAQQKGVVDWLGGPQPYLAPEVLKSLIRLDELWVWDDNRDEYTTIQLVGDDVVIEGKDRHRNIFADAFDPDDKQKSKKSYAGNPLSQHHPFCEICPNILDGYFWGRSEICNMGLLQKAINARLNGIGSLLRLQEDPPRYFKGSQGITQQSYAKLKKPGGYLADTAPNATMQTLAPELPSGLWDSLHEYERILSKMAGFQNVTQGMGEAGVRSQGHAETLVRTGATRFKDRALIVERQVEAIGGLAMDMLKAKLPTEMVAWMMPKDTMASKVASIFTKFSEDEFGEAPVAGMKPVKFLMHQLPKNCKIVVDSHSSSPAFSHETQNLLFSLFKAGAIKPERLVEKTHPPGQDELIEDLKQAEIEKQKFAQEHPELAMEQASKKKK